MPRFFARGRRTHLFDATRRPPAAVFALAAHQVGRDAAMHDLSVHLEAISVGSSCDYDTSLSYCQKLCMGLSCGGAILAFSIHEFDASNDLGELI